MVSSFSDKTMNTVEARDAQTHAIIGAAMEVHRVLGPGFLEGVYQEALEVELSLRGIPYEFQRKLPVAYKERVLKCFCRADFVCYQEIIVELKALQKLTTMDDSQVINYLKATTFERGLLFNFGTPSLEFKRLVFSNARKQSQTGPEYR
jgi:GxxExxY protein